MYKLLSKSLSLAYLTTALTLSFGISANAADTKAEGYKKESPKAFSQDTYATPADQQLNKKIRDNVSKGWLWDSYKEVTLNTTNGVVTLEGTVENMEDQQKLAKGIQKIEGVKEVKSNLKLKKN